MRKIAVPNLLASNRTKIIACVAIAVMLSLTYMSPINIKQSAAVLTLPPHLQHYGQIIH